MLIMECVLRYIVYTTIKDLFSINSESMWINGEKKLKEKATWIQ